MNPDVARDGVNVSQVVSGARSVPPLISAEELLQLTRQSANVSTEAPALRLIDCRYFLGAPTKGLAEFQQGHIPLALYADLEADLSGPVVAGRTGRHPLPSPEALASRLGAWGIQPTDWVVAYDHVDGSMAAARLWWLLRYVGHATVSVLDGGLNAWRDVGGALTSETTLFEPSVYVPKVASELAVTVSEVSAAATQSEHVLFDARAPERFRGEVEPIDKVAGRIPGAQSLPYATLMKQGRFAPKEVILDLLKRGLGAVRPEDAVVYCGSGVTACEVLLGAEHAGVRGIRLYPGSYSEWIADGSRGTERG